MNWPQEVKVQYFEAAKVELPVFLADGCLLLATFTSYFGEVDPFFFG